MGSNSRTPPWDVGLTGFTLMDYPKHLASVMANGFDSLYLRKILNSPREQRTNLHSSRLSKDSQESAFIHLRSQSYRNRAPSHQSIPYWDRSRGSCQTCFSATEARCFGHHKTDPKRTGLKLLSWKRSIDWIALPNPVSNHEQHLLDNLQHMTQHSLDKGSSCCPG